VGQEAASKLRSAGNPTDLSSRDKEKITKNIQPRSRRPSDIPVRTTRAVDSRPGRSFIKKQTSSHRVDSLRLDAWKKPWRRQALSIRESTGVDQRKDDKTTRVVLSAAYKERNVYCLSWP
jgi:hypothetical protein